MGNSVLVAFQSYISVSMGLVNSINECDKNKVIEIGEQYL